jgi:hypothetical protein
MGESLSAYRGITTGVPTLNATGNARDADG